MITPEHYLIVALILFAIGALGVMARRNLFAIFISIELMLNAVNLVFATYSSALGIADGHVISMLIIALAGAEAALGLSILIVLYRNFQSLDIDIFSKIKG